MQYLFFLLRVDEKMHKSTVSRVEKLILGFFAFLLEKNDYL